MWTLLLIVSMFAQLDYMRPQVPIVGIVEAPELLGAYVCDRFVPEPVDVYEAPTSGSARLGVLETTKAWYLDSDSDCDSIEVVFRNAATGETEELQFREYSYEFMGLVVVEAMGDWLRISSRGNIGWIESPEAERFHAYEQLVETSLSYLTDDWARGLWAVPGLGSPVAVPAEWGSHDEPTVEVVESRRIDGELWFRIRLDAEYGCGTLAGDLPTTEGWVPAYTESGVPQVWYYSRGC